MTGTVAVVDNHAILIGLSYNNRYHPILTRNDLSDQILGVNLQNAGFDNNGALTILQPNVEVRSATLEMLVY